METAYTEDYLFTLWALKQVPYPRNATVQVDTSNFGLRAGLSRLTDAERAVWEHYRTQAKAALGARFIPERY